MNNTTNEHIDTIEALARLNERLASATTLAEVRAICADEQMRRADYAAWLAQ